MGKRKLVWSMLAGLGLALLAFGPATRAQEDSNSKPSDESSQKQWNEDVERVSESALKLRIRHKRNHLEKQAMRSLIDEDYGSAIKLAEKLMSVDPQSVEAYLDRGLAYKKLGRGEDALKDYQQAIANAKQKMSQSGLSKEEREDARTAVAHAYFEVGGFYLSQVHIGDRASDPRVRDIHQKAYEAYLQAYQNGFSNRAFTEWELSMCLAGLNRVEESAKMYDSALKDDPDLAHQAGHKERCQYYAEAGYTASGCK